MIRVLTEPAQRHIFDPQSTRVVDEAFGRIGADPGNNDLFVEQTQVMARRIYASLGIEKREIDRGQAWQNYIEANFGTMRRMADYHFARAATWPELHAVHDRFFHDYNHQPHFAHQDRPAGRRSPAQVLGWVRGTWCDPADLDRLFRLCAHRRVDRHGFVRYRHWRFYGERGLAGAEATVWVFGNDLTVEYATDTVARYHVAYEPDERHLRAVTDPRLYETRYPSPQPFLGALAAVEWRPALRLPGYATRRKRATEAGQEPLFVLEDERTAREA